MRIDCGTEDFLLQENRLFHAHLDKIGVTRREGDARVLR